MQNLNLMTKTQLINEALSMKKYLNDIDAVIIMNDILEELKWHMTSNSFEEFKKKELLNAI